MTISGLITRRAERQPRNARESFAKAVSSAEAMPAATRVVFLCYSRRDRGIVRKCQAVIRAAGMIPWRDEDSIPAGHEVAALDLKVIDDHATEPSVLLVTVTAPASEEVRAETLDRHQGQQAHLP